VKEKDYIDKLPLTTCAKSNLWHTDKQSIWVIQQVSSCSLSRNLLGVKQRFDLQQCSPCTSSKRCFILCLCFSWYPHYWPINLKSC
jgi:hypothetical protein